MLAWFKRLLRPAAPAPAPAGGLPESPASPAAPAPQVPLPTEPEGFEAAWHLLTVEPLPEASPLEPTDAELAQAMAELLMAHFQANRPGPASFPAVAARIVDLLNQEDPDIAALGTAVSQDPAITAQVLRVANSAAYQRGSEAQSLREAILRLGSRQVAEIALGVAGRSLFDVSLRMEFDLFQARWRELFVSTMTCAFTASHLAFREQVGRAERAFLAGMFHDIGTPLALRSLAKVLIEGQLPSSLPDVLVDEALDLAHVTVGLEIHEIWALPHAIQGLCEQHHAPELPAEEAFAEAHVLRLVTGLARLQRETPDLRHLPEARQSLRALGLDRKRTAKVWEDLIQQRERVLQLYP